MFNIADSSSLTITNGKINGDTDSFSKGFMVEEENSLVIDGVSLISGVTVCDIAAAKSKNINLNNCEIKNSYATGLDLDQCESVSVTHSKINN